MMCIQMATEDEENVGWASPTLQLQRQSELIWLTSPLTPDSSSKISTFAPSGVSQQRAASAAAAGVSDLDRHTDTETWWVRSPSEAAGVVARAASTPKGASITFESELTAELWFADRSPIGASAVATGLSPAYPIQNELLWLAEEQDASPATKDVIQPQSVLAATAVAASSPTSPYQVSRRQPSVETPKQSDHYRRIRANNTGWTSTNGEYLRSGILSYCINADQVRRRL
jgi:hypothetical protein